MRFLFVVFGICIGWGIGVLFWLGLDAYTGRPLSANEAYSRSYSTNTNLDSKNKILRTIYQRIRLYSNSDRYVFTDFSEIFTTDLVTCGEVREELESQGYTVTIQPDEKKSTYKFKVSWGNL